MPPDARKNLKLTLSKIFFPHLFLLFPLTLALSLALSLVIFSAIAAGPALAATYTDDLGETLSFFSSPKRVVSLSPGATEIICAVKADKALAGITMDDSYFECLNGVPAVGPAAKPSYEIVNSLKPDLLIVPQAQYQNAVAARGNAKYKIMVWENPKSPEEANARIAAFGEIFGKTKEGAEAFAESQGYLDTIAMKLEKLPGDKKLKAMRLRAFGDGLATGGTNSMDSQLIKAAGGIPPEFGMEEIIPLKGDEIRSFDPEYIYACGEDSANIAELIKKRPYSGLKAVKNNRIDYFPCALTNRMSAHVGYFVGWLSSGMYSKEYGVSQNFAMAQEIIGERKIPISKKISYVKEAKVKEFRLFDFIHRALLIEFNSPQNVVSSGDGAWENVSVIGNSGSPPMVWSIQHEGGWKDAENTLYDVLGIKRDDSCLIFTGADIRALSVQTASYKDLTVMALITAGADGNALRTSKDPGNWYDPGTINIILLSSRALLPGGAAGAHIVITEAKTAALWDMDIRSTESPRVNPATGTGTDDIIVATGGVGNPAEYVGGHGKIGELIGRVVYDGVTEALKKQNGKAKNRTIWQRLDERRLPVESLGKIFRGQGPYPDLGNDLKLLFLDPRYAGFLESALSLSDAEVMGNYKDAGSFTQSALRVASEVAGAPVGAIEDLISAENIPPLVETALNALATGLASKNRNLSELKEAIKTLK
jgi:ABC-type Fe3+-hydroxamate transport system substrate-binding protein/adenosylcobinamide amidohydrolase